MNDKSKIKEYRRIVVDGQYYYGKHLIVSAKACNENILSKEFIAQFLKDIVLQIDMVAFGEPLIERLGEGIEIGISAIQLITTSTITIHTYDMARDLYLDVFSCKNYNEQVVLDRIVELFAPEVVEHDVLLRR